MTQLAGPFSGSDFPLSSPDQLKAIVDRLYSYLRLPFARGVPGFVIESAIQDVRGGRITSTKAFVDVVDEVNGVGWQVKSARIQSPLTWKRAALETEDQLIGRAQSGTDEEQAIGRKALGAAIIASCNKKVAESVAQYGLQHLIYARLVDFGNNRFMYFERPLPLINLFDPDAFEWQWATKALHGTMSGEKWLVWHGRGDNQLHFHGEKSWWPSEEDKHHIRFQGPETVITWDALMSYVS